LYVRLLLTRSAQKVLSASFASSSVPILNSPLTPTLYDLDHLKTCAQFACQLADAARREILPYWRHPRLYHPSTNSIQTKTDPNRPPSQTESPVTIADRNAEAAMRELIHRIHPTHGIIGEEFGNHNADAEFVWVLDPIDGTKSFMTGKPLFGTLIGLCRDGVPLVGIIDQPVLEERWVGIVHHGTTLNGQVVQTGDIVHNLSDAMMYTTDPQMFREGYELERFTSIRDAVKSPVYGGDCYSYACVASGYADLVVEADLGVYDYAAIVPVIQGAGGYISNWEGGDLHLDKHDTECHGRVVAAANHELWTSAIDLLSSDTDG